MDTTPSDDSPDADAVIDLRRVGAPPTVDLRSSPAPAAPGWVGSDDDPFDDDDAFDDDELHDPEPAPWDGRRVPVTFLGGYLGAGKTTVVNELLARTDRPIAVLVNDVGAVNVDASLVRRRHGDTIELTDGCVCCSLRAGMAEAFDSLRARETAPDHVIVELSGVADPRRVLLWGDSPGFRLDGVVVLVDAERAASLEADPVVGGAFTGQIAAADLVLLTKLDLATSDDVDTAEAVVARHAPAAPVLAAAHAMGAAGVLAIGGRRPQGPDAVPDPSLFDVHDVATVAFPPLGDLAALETLLDGLPDDTLRAKGVAALADGTRVLVQVVGRRRATTLLPPAEDHPPTDLVVIRPRRT